MRVLPAILLATSATLATAISFDISSGSQKTLAGASIPGENPLVYCEATDDYILDIDYINISPNPPVIGQSFSIEAKGNLKQNVTDGAYIKLEVSFGFIKLVQQTIGLCDQVGAVNLTCPLEKGEVKILKEAEIPKEAPAGQYTVKADVYTVANEKITCLIGEKIPMHKA
jgi:hypothetical protein